MHGETNRCRLKNFYFTCADQTLTMATAAVAAAGSFDGLGLKEEVLGIIRDKFRFAQMTPVQAATLPKFLQHKDVAVEVHNSAPS